MMFCFEKVKKYIISIEIKVVSLNIQLNKKNQICSVQMGSALIIFILLLEKHNNLILNKIVSIRKKKSYVMKNDKNFSFSNNQKLQKTMRNRGVKS